MDVQKTLRELHAERKRLVAVIASLERRLQTESAGPRKRRGRKHMSAQERRQVSERMRRYWESRRAQAQALAATANGISRPKD